jgi:MFS family permease
MTANQLKKNNGEHKITFNNLTKHITYPWLCWFLCSCFIFYKYVLQVSPSIMTHELMSAFNLTGLGLGSLAACYFYAYLCMQLPVGIILDRYNPRILISSAILVCSLGAFIFSQANTLFPAQIGRILIGIGGAFSAVGTMKIISIWFPSRQFALMSGLMMAMAMLGAIGGEAPLSLLIHQVGWRDAIMWCSLSGLVLALFIFIFIKNKDETKSKENISSFKTLGKGLLKIIKNKQTWFLSFYSGLAFAPISAFAGLWGVSFICQKYAIDRSSAASFVSMSFVGFAIGSPFAGWLSDKIKRRKPIMICGTAISLIAICLIIYWPTLSYLSLTSLFLIFGFSSGFFFVSFATMRESQNLDLSGTSIGFINMFNALFGALFEPFIGYLLDTGWGHQIKNGAHLFSLSDYQTALTTLPAGLFIALLCQLFIKETFCIKKDE